MKIFIGSYIFCMFFVLTAFANDKPHTNWGAVLKVPVEKSKAIENGLFKVACRLG